MARILALPPEREPLEREIAELFGNGDFTDIARLTQRDYSQVTRSFSTTDPTRLNPVFQIIIHLWAFDCIRHKLADTVLAIILREREKWLAGELRIAEHPASLTKNVGDEFMEAVECEIKGESIDRQIDEWNDVLVKVKVKLNTLTAKRAVQRLGDSVEIAA